MVLFREDRASGALVPEKQDMLRVAHHSLNFPVTSPDGFDQKHPTSYCPPASQVPWGQSLSETHLPREFFPPQDWSRAPKYVGTVSFPPLTV